MRLTYFPIKFKFYSLQELPLASGRRALKSFMWNVKYSTEKSYLALCIFWSFCSSFVILSIVLSLIGVYLYLLAFEGTYFCRKF